jgi:uncharacterized membrane protein
MAVLSPCKRASLKACFAFPARYSLGLNSPPKITAPATVTTAAHRLAYLDWLRGLACVLMFEVHCYDSWLGGSARHGNFFGLSQFSGTLPAPLFVLIAGIACALLTDRLRRKGVAANAIASKTIKRGAQIFAFALLFRLQEFLLGWGYSPWTDLLRVDILNLIGLSLVLMGIVNRLAQSRRANALLAAALALAISLATPLLWTTHQPRWLPWYLESYINGVHTFGVPQSWLFPLFPWAAFGFAGLVIGFILTSDWAETHQDRAVARLGIAGVAIFLLSLFLNLQPIRVYAVHDYWHTSPAFFLARVGVVLAMLWGAYAWCRWGLGQRGFSPLIQLGQTSLLVYWVHTEFVYGRLSILPKNAQGIAMATLGLLVITIAMVLLSMARTRVKGRGAEITGWFHRGHEKAAATGD